MLFAQKIKNDKLQHIFPRYLPDFKTYLKKINNSILKLRDADKPLLTIKKIRNKSNINSKPIKFVWTLENHSYNVNKFYKNPIIDLHYFLKQIKYEKNILIAKQKILQRPHQIPSDPLKYLLIEKNLVTYNDNIGKLEKLFNKLITAKFQSFAKKLNFIRFHQSKDNIIHKILVRNYLNIKQNNLCSVCGTTLDDDCTFEHLKARSNNGLVSVDNGTATHLCCNNYLGILDKNRKERMLIEDY